MRVWAVFNGGHLGPSGFQDADLFDSIGHLKRVFVHETDDLPSDHPDEATVWFYDPNGEDVRDPYPDEVWTIGPRQGIRREKA